MISKMSISSFSDVESILSSKRPDINTVNWFFELDDMKKLMRLLGNPQDNFKVVHVAGTSGKTSTAYYIANMLRLAGNKTGLTVSPHVDSVSERVQINGQPLSEHEFVSLFEEFIELKVVRSMEITYFGLLVAFAYWVFAKKRVDYAVVEVGMGGKLDATNIIGRPDKVCIITDIGLDHTKHLGESLSEIANQKAGIIGQDQHVFVSGQDEQVMKVFRGVCEQENAELHVLFSEKVDPSIIDLPLFQQRNWSLAKLAFDFIAKRDGLFLESNQIKESTTVNIPARMEEFRLINKTILIDGSHNSQKIGALVSAIKQKYPNTKSAVLVSMVEGKDTTLEDSLKALSQVTDTLIVTEFNSSQDVQRTALKTKVITDKARGVGLKNIIEIANPEQAFKILLEQPEKLLIVTGSFFLLNHVRPSLLASVDPK